MAATGHPPERLSEMCVLLLVHRRNRELLQQCLSGHYTVRTPDDAELPASFDLCIVDPPSLRCHREALRARKEAAGAVFLPYLLVVRESERSRLGASVWEQVDDLLLTPVTPAELGARIQNLLRIREQSLRLEQRKERELSEQRAFIESAINAIPDIFYVYDLEGSFLRWNDQALAVTGYTEAELRELDPTDFVPAEDAQWLDAQMQTVVETGVPVTAETAIVTKAGEELPYELKVAPLVGPDGETLGLVGIGRDITDRKMRKELARQNERLEKFASIVSHDLRNPLGVANGYLTLAQSQVDDDHLDGIEQALDRMERLIDDLLTLAREGQVVGETEAVTLSTAVNSAWTEAGPPEGTLTVEADLDFLADGNRLCSLLENLFRNAREHAGEDATVTVGPLADGFYVADDGPGIPAEHHEKAFEYGYTSREGGTGFGLAIVKEIAEAHGWSVRVTDGEEGGARFEFTGVTLI